VDVSVTCRWLGPRPVTYLSCGAGESQLDQGEMLRSACTLRGLPLAKARGHALAGVRGQAVLRKCQVRIERRSRRHASGRQTRWKGPAVPDGHAGMEARRIGIFFLRFKVGIGVTWRGRPGDDERKCGRWRLDAPAWHGGALCFAILCMSMTSGCLWPARVGHAGMERGRPSEMKYSTHVLKCQAWVGDGKGQSGSQLGTA